LSVETRSPLGQQHSIVIRVGSADVWRGNAIHYARIDGTDATFVINRGKVNALLDALAATAAPR
jgi:hypothetical protein